MQAGCAIATSRFQNEENENKIFLIIFHLADGTTVTHTHTHKAVPLQAWTGPQDSRKLRFPDYMTTAQDGGKVVSPTHRQPLPAPTPREMLQVLVSVRG